jgi:hypothetical protein
LTFFVVGASKSQYRPKVEGDGAELHLGMVLPHFFLDPNRLLLANDDDDLFTENSSKATAFQEAVAKLDKQLKLTDEKDILFASAMKLKTPFKVEDEIHEWEMQAFDNDDEEYAAETGSQQYFFILSVELRSVEKIKRAKKQGKFRIIGSPNKAPRNKKADSDEEDGGMEEE